MRRESKCLPTKKKKSNTKEGSNGGTEEQKRYKI